MNGTGYRQGLRSIIIEMKRSGIEMTVLEVQGICMKF